ncbi:MAG: hypothetical protein JXL67_12240 [Calditrichaeota bacterium]|nr:hypothetical protein [Calditrichota bacterium]
MRAKAQLRIGAACGGANVEFSGLADDSPASPLERFVRIRVIENRL